MEYEQLISKFDRKHIPALDGVRAIAALIVVFYHLYLRHLSWLPDGSFGVLIFFVLSGFLITWLLLKEADRSGTVSLRGFYFRRSIRIFPAFYACFIVNFAALLLSSRAVPWTACLSTGLYFQDYYFPFHEEGNFMGFSWSLAVEEQFYLIWPIIFKTFQGRRQALAKWLVGVTICTWVYRAILIFAVHPPEHYISYSFDCHIDHLTVGALAAIALRSGWLRRFWSVVCSPLYATLSVILLALSVELQHRFGHAYDHTFGFTFDPIVIAILLVQLISLASVAPFSWLNLPIPLFLGRISYPIYLYHSLAITLAGRFVHGHDATLRPAASVLLALGFATASYFLIERYFLTLKKSSQAKLSNLPLTPVIT